MCLLSMHTIVRPHVLCSQVLQNRPLGSNRPQNYINAVQGKFCLQLCCSLKFPPCAAARSVTQRSCVAQEVHARIECVHKCTPHKHWRQNFGSMMVQSPRTHRLLHEAHPAIRSGQELRVRRVWLSRQRFRKFGGCGNSLKLRIR